jgi:hypothetical protein
MRRLFLFLLLLGLVSWVQAQEITFTSDTLRKWVEPGEVGYFSCELANLWNDSNHVALRMEPHFPAGWRVNICNKYGCLPPDTLYVDYVLNPLEVDTAVSVDIHASSTPDSGWVITTAMSLEDTNVYRETLTHTLITYPNGVIVKTEPGIPKQFLLSQNYPNPFNPSTTITISIPSEQIGQEAGLSVYDVLGREVQRLFQGPLTAGTLVVTWNGRDAGNHAVSSGTYFYRFSTGQVNAIRSMQLIR